MILFYVTRLGTFAQWGYIEMRLGIEGKEACTCHFPELTSRVLHVHGDKMWTHGLFPPSEFGRQRERKERVREEHGIHTRERARRVGVKGRQANPMFAQCHARTQKCGTRFSKFIRCFVETLFVEVIKAWRGLFTHSIRLECMEVRVYVCLSSDEGIFF